MPHVAPLPIIEVGEYKLMVDTGCVVLQELVYPIGYEDPPQNLNVLGNVVPLTPSPWGGKWLYADHQLMFNNERVGGGQQFDFILTGGWYRGKTITFTDGTIRVEPQGTLSSPNIVLREHYPIITVDGRRFLFDSGIPFSTTFTNLPLEAEEDLKDYQLCFSPLGGGILKIKTTQGSGDLLWLTGWQKSDATRSGSLQDLSELMQRLGADIVGCIGSDYLLKHNLTIAY